MQITVQVEPKGGAPPDVEYRWDADTAILTANLADATRETAGGSGSVELAGNDGSWLILDVKEGNLHGVEVAVWPDLKKRPTLAPPAEAEIVRLVVPAKGSAPGVQLLQMDTTVVAEADSQETTIHFRLGAARAARTVRIARDMLIDVDDHHVLRGIWLLNVPPFPTDE